METSVVQVLRQAIWGQKSALPAMPEAVLSRRALVKALERTEAGNA